MKIHNLISTGATAELVLIDCKPMLLIRTPSQPPLTLQPTEDLLKFFNLEQEHKEMLEWLREQDLHEKIQAFEELHPAIQPIENIQRKRPKL